MNKQIFAVLSLVCGLLGFNLIAIAQTMAFMQIRNYSLTKPDLDVSLFAIGGTYKGACFVMGLTAIILFYLYTRSSDNSARLFNGLGGILGFITVILSLAPIYLWLL